MDELEISKIFGAGCAALLAFVGFGQLGSAMVSVDQLDEPAFIVEIEEESGEVEVADALPVGQLMALAEMDHGAKVFKKCSSCHKVEAGASGGQGPNLWNIVGREIAAVDDYAYSDALKGHGGDWDFAALDGFLLKPTDWAPGTKMGFAGLSKDRDRASVIAWLNEQGDSPLAMPAVEEEAEVAEVAEVAAEENAAEEVMEGTGEVRMTESDDAVEVTAKDVELANVETAREATDDMPVPEAAARVQVPEEQTGSTEVTEDAQDGKDREVAQDNEVIDTERRALADEVQAADDKEFAAPTPEAQEEAAAKAEEPAKMAMVETAEPAAASGFMALADMKKGKKVFNKCRACHKVKPGKNGVGPSLHGVVGREIGAVDGFKYSDALLGKGGKWDVEALNAFLEKPKGWAPGTKMAFPGLRKEEDRASIIAWLNEQSDAPIDLGQ